MRMLIDSIRFQNKNHYGGADPIIAEVHVIVDNIPDFDEEEYEIETKFPNTGFYYVSLYVKNEYTNTEEEWNKHYFVSKGSVYDYMYDKNGIEEDPGILEKYDRIVDAEQSAFIDYFLLLDEYLTCSRENHLSNVARTERFEEEKAECTIEIDSLKKYKIVTEYKISSDKKIILSINSGITVGTGKEVVILPERYFSVCEKSDSGEYEKSAEFPYVENSSDKSLFHILCGLERFTEIKIERFFEEKRSALPMPEEEQDFLKKSILRNGFGRE